MKRRLFKFVMFAILGVIINIAVAWGCVFLNIELDRRPRSTALWNADGYWHLLEYRQAGAMWVFSSRQRLTGLAYDKIERDGDPRQFCPSWTGFDQVPVEYNQFATRQFFMVNQLADARGWPVYSLWSEPCMTHPSASGKVVVTARGGICMNLSQQQRHYFDPWRDDLFPVSKVLPLRPIWPGFAINTLFYAAIPWLLFAVPSKLRRTVRRRCGRCIKCGYDLRGTPHDACPECGTLMQ